MEMTGTVNGKREKERKRRMSKWENPSYLKEKIVCKSGQMNKHIQHCLHSFNWWHWKKKHWQRIKNWPISLAWGSQVHISPAKFNSKVSFKAFLLPLEPRSTIVQLIPTGFALFLSRTKRLFVLSQIHCCSLYRKSLPFHSKHGTDSEMNANERVQTKRRFVGMCNFQFQWHFTA